jgi:hypothetical protein
MPFVHEYVVVLCPEASAPCTVELQHLLCMVKCFGGVPVLQLSAGELRIGMLLVHPQFFMYLPFAVQ